jgi:hypothetical protein
VVGPLRETGDLDSWFGAFLWLILIAILVGAVYRMLADLLNRTEVMVDHATVRAWYKPLPWPGAVIFSKYDIARLYCQEVRTVSRTGDTESFTIMVVDIAGLPKPLLHGVDCRTALLIQEKLEERLGLSRSQTRPEHNGTRSQRITKRQQ